MDMSVRSASDLCLEEAAAQALPGSDYSSTSIPAHPTLAAPQAQVRGFPLAMARAGSSLRLVSYGCGRNAQRRLADQGLTVGVTIAVIGNDPCGPMIVGVRGVRVGLGKGLAHKVMVVETEAER